MSKSMQQITEKIDPERAVVLQKERRKVLKKIQTQADIDHTQMINSKK